MFPLSCPLGLGVAIGLKAGEAVQWTLLARFNCNLAPA
jgi:hypothetical protein